MRCLGTSEGGVQRSSHALDPACERKLEQFGQALLAAGGDARPAGRSHLGSQVPAMRPSGALLQYDYVDVLAIFEKYGASEPHVYGSVARRTDTEGSDFNCFATFGPGAPWHDQWFDLERELERLLRCSVGVFSDTIKTTRVGHRVRRDMVPLLDLYDPAFHNLPPSYPVEWTTGRRAELERLFGWRLVDHLDLIVYWCDEVGASVSAIATAAAGGERLAAVEGVAALLSHVGYFCNELGRVRDSFVEWDRRKQLWSIWGSTEPVDDWSCWARWSWRDIEPSTRQSHCSGNVMLWAAEKAPVLRGYVKELLGDDPP